MPGLPGGILWFCAVHSLCSCMQQPWKVLLFQFLSMQKLEWKSLSNLLTVIVNKWKVLFWLISIMLSYLPLGMVVPWRYQGHHNFALPTFYLLALKEILMTRLMLNVCLRLPQRKGRIVYFATHAEHTENWGQFSEHM